MSQSVATKRKPATRQAALSMRIAPGTRDELVARARRAGRSVTQEADHLLQQAMLFEELLGKPGLQHMSAIKTEFDTYGAARAAERGIAGDWTQDPDCYMAAAVAAIKQLIALTPGPWNGDLWHLYLTQAVISAQRRRTEGLPGGFVDQGPIEPITVELPERK